MNSSRRALENNENEKLLSNFQIIFELLAKNLKMFKRIAGREYWSKCNMLYINGFALTSSTKKLKAFLKF